SENFTFDFILAEAIKKEDKKRISAAVKGTVVPSQALPPQQRVGSGRNASAGYEKASSTDQANTFSVKDMRTCRNCNAYHLDKDCAPGLNKIKCRQCQQFGHVQLRCPLIHSEFRPIKRERLQQFGTFQGRPEIRPTFQTATGVGGERFNNPPSYQGQRFPGQNNYRFQGIQNGGNNYGTGYRNSYRPRMQGTFQGNTGQGVALTTGVDPAFVDAIATARTFNPQYQQQEMQGNCVQPKSAMVQSSHPEQSSMGASNHLPPPPQTTLNPQAQVFENSNQRQPSAFYVTAGGEKINFYSQENQERINELKMKYKNMYTADGFQFDNMGPLTWSAEDV
ncbi:MAG: hypothetical protein GY737_20380, partial [Desulfobacteraceae bacterium]|nr:hypothetical protein [Desulfobacteraceae bacterium]